MFSLATGVLYIYQDDYIIFRHLNIKPPLCSADNASYSWLYISGFYLSAQVNDMRHWPSTQSKIRA